ncbi:MAG: hypothetical protein ABL999_04065 [Pyrinomonadaceae bacterium]
MNSEELEQSLKTEFESYLKSVLAEMKQETTEFQSRIEAEFEKQKSQIDEAFKGFAARFDSDRTFDAAFIGSVGEHLRLARDEGARVAANAMVEAENLGQSPLAAVPVAVPVEVKYDAIRDAVDDISSKESQSAILKSLVHHAANFAPRGAFFIIKSDHFSGWKVFGADEAAENAIRDIHFPVSSDSILGAAVAAKSTVDNVDRSHPVDSAFLNPLQFGEPEKMLAIPLVARGRGVAVLYADHGTESGEDSSVNREALETLVRVAGLTVELLASMQTAKAENRTVAAADFEDVGAQAEETSVPGVEPAIEEPASPAFETAEESVSEHIEPTPAYDSPFEAPADEEPAAFTDAAAKDEPGFAFSDSVSFEGGFPSEVSSNPFDAEPASYGAFDSPEQHVAEAATVETAFDDNPFAEKPFIGDEAVRQAELAASFESPVETFEPHAETFVPPVETFEPVVEEFQPAVESFEPVAEQIEVEEPKGSDMVFDSENTFDEVPSVSSPFEQPVEQFEPAAVTSGGGFAQQMEAPVMEAPVVQAPKPRLSERNVDLPIEVPEEERRIHNDARRFARLLVSEIKLYNEKKVIEGREAGDLYDRLREAIDRSREMYDKRVQPPVAAKFDYFHYEIVNSLAEGTAERLGSGYPGASI